ncbi:MAG: phosphoribosylformylglycinamidine synthase subunit PurQ [Acidobacteria bacterium]|nr:phosphoribosylformylglycinamidine synthase subunit PurQ [Acidobacteriota bacterium]
MRFSILVFPGSNCDYDAYHSIRHVLGQDAEFIWHEETDLKNPDCVILPGGFSYGDYLRCGAMASFSPAMERVKSFANDGGLVLGICNGFQVLTETGMLPGALLRNRSLSFVCRDVYLKTENTALPFTRSLDKNRTIRIPIAHAEGNYFCDPETLEELEREKRVVFRYCDRKGNVTEEANPNGSLNNIAGITNREGNVLGMMPHPERAMESIVGNTDGMGVFQSLLAQFQKTGAY